MADERHLPARRDVEVDAHSDDAVELARSMGMSYHKGDIDEALGMEVGFVEEGKSMVIIQLGGGLMSRVDVTYDWLVGILPPEPRQQILDACLVIATDPNARLCQVIKADVDRGDMLVMHTAAMG